MIDDKQQKFIDNYLLTFNMEGSARAAGYPRENSLQIAIDLLSNDMIIQALQERSEQLNKVMQGTKLTKERFITTMYYQYTQAVNRGDIRGATDILEKIARWNGLEPDAIDVNPINLIINNVDENKL